VRAKTDSKPPCRRLRRNRFLTDSVFAQSAKRRQRGFTTLIQLFYTIMPVRMLRPGLRTSRRFNKLSWPAQSFYVRLFSLVDDYGRYEGDQELLRSECFPFGDPNGKPVSMTTIADICQQLTANGMVKFYTGLGDKEFLQVTRWKERARSDSRFPEPSDSNCQTSDSNCQQMIASPPTPTPTPTPSPSVTPSQESHNGFRKPSLEQIKLQAAKIGLPESECVHFLNHYEANGWRIGRSPMKSWPHALSNWNLNHKKGTYSKPQRRDQDDAFNISDEELVRRAIQ